jgi:integrase/recombinase XerD
MDWSSIQASQILSFIRNDVRRAKTAESARHMTTAVRSLLNYLHLSGLMTKDLCGVVPAVAGWSLATIPKGLSRDQVNWILKSCDCNTLVGRRDYAILLLLARLGCSARSIACREDSSFIRAGILGIGGDSA